MRLDEARGGETLQVVHLPVGTIRLQFLRMGISEGERVECLENLPRGPIILRSHHQEIAIGRGLARRIEVRGVEICSG